MNITVLFFLQATKQGIARKVDRYHECGDPREGEYKCKVIKKKDIKGQVTVLNEGMQKKGGGE